VGLSRDLTRLASLYKVSFLLLAIASIATISITAISDTSDSGYCFAYAQDEGVLTFSRSETYAHGSGSGYYYGLVSDNYADGLYVAAGFKPVVDYKEYPELIYGVPDGGFTDDWRSFSGVRYFVEGVTTGYYGVKDSRAIATAYYSMYCPE